MMIRQDEISMDKYIMSKEEQAYLAGYDISAFDRPSVAADMAVF